MEIDRDAFIKAANELNKNELVLYLLLMGTRDGYGISGSYIESATGIDEKHLPEYRKKLVDKGYINYKPYSHYEVLGYKSDSNTPNFGGHNITGDTKSIMILKSLLIEGEYRQDIITYLFHNSPLNKNQMPEIELLIDKFKIDNTVPYYFIYKTLHGKVFRQRDIHSFNHLKNVITSFLRNNINKTIDSECSTSNDSYSLIPEEEYNSGYETDSYTFTLEQIDNSPLPF